MFSVTTVLPEKDQPITKAKLIEATKTPKTEEELAEMEAAKKAKEEADNEGKDVSKKKKKKKKKKKLDLPKEEDLYHFTPIPLAQ